MMATGEGQLPRCGSSSLQSAQTLQTGDIVPGERLDEEAADCNDPVCGYTAHSMIAMLESNTSAISDKYDHSSYKSS